MEEMMKTKILKVLIVMMAAIMLLLCIGCSKQAPDELDAAIQAAADYLNDSDNIPTGSKFGILYIISPSADLSNYIIDGIYTNMEKKGTFVVEQYPRGPASHLFEDDDTSLQITGAMMGAQIVVTGKVEKIDNNYRLTINALETQTATIMIHFIRNIPAGKTINALISGK